MFIGILILYMLTIIVGVILSKFGKPKLFDITSQPYWVILFVAVFLISFFATPKSTEVVEHGMFLHQTVEICESVSDSSIDYTIGDFARPQRKSNEDALVSGIYHTKRTKWTLSKSKEFLLYPMGVKNMHSYNPEDMILHINKVE